MGVQITLAYGQNGLSVQFPEEANVTLIRKPSLPHFADPKAAIRTALDNPLGSASLRELAKGRSSACILICDITRPCPIIFSCDP